MSNMKQWGLFMNYYTDDNNDRFMRWTKGSVTEGPGTWVRYLYPYYIDGGIEICICPEATKTPQEGETNLAHAAWADTVMGEFHKNSYVINNWCYDLNTHTNPDYLWSYSGAIKNAWRKTTGHKNAYNIPMFLEGWMMGGVVQSRNEEPPLHEGFSNAAKTMGFPGFGKFTVDRHFGSVNVCFMDFTVRRVGLRELWDLKWHRNYSLSDPLPLNWHWLEDYPD